MLPRTGREATWSAARKSTWIITGRPIQRLHRCNPIFSLTKAQATTANPNHLQAQKIDNFLDLQGAPWAPFCFKVCWFTTKLNQEIVALPYHPWDSQKMIYAIYGIKPPNFAKCRGIEAIL
jgi:hypothetical protein